MYWKDLFLMGKAILTFIVIRYVLILTVPLLLIWKLISLHPIANSVTVVAFLPTKGLHPLHLTAKGVSYDFDYY